MSKTSRFIVILLTGVTSVVLSLLLYSFGFANLEADDPAVMFDFIDQNYPLGVISLAVATLCVLNWIVYIYKKNLKLYSSVIGLCVLWLIMLLYILFFQ